MKKKLIIGLTLAATLGICGAFAGGLLSSSKIIPTTTSNKQEVESAREEGYDKGYDDALSSIFDEESIQIMQELYSANIVYSKVLSNGDTLFSTDSSSQQGIYFLRQGKYYKIYDKGYRLSDISETDDNIFASSSLSSFKGILKINKETMEVTQIYNDGYNWRGSRLVDGNMVFVAIQNTEVVHHDNQTNVTKVLENTNGGYAKAFGMTDGTLMLYKSGSLEAYDLTTQTITQTFNLGTFVCTDCITFKNGNALFCQSVMAEGTSGSGIIRYKSATKEISKICEERYQMVPVKSLDENRVLLSSTKEGSANGAGIVLYDSISDTWEFKYTSNSKWNCSFDLPTGNFLIGSPNTYAKGILIFNRTDDTITQIYADGVAWDTFKGDESGVTITSSKKPEQGKLRYDFVTGEVSKVMEE